MSATSADNPWSLTGKGFVLKRIITLVKGLLLIVSGLALIGVTGVLVVNAARTGSSLIDALNVQARHAGQGSQYRNAATQIAISNATLSDMRTHAPTDTLTPTDSADNGSGDGSGSTGSMGGNNGPLPTDIPQNTFKMRPMDAQQVVPSETPAPPVTHQAPPPTNTPRPTEAITNTAVPPTLPPTDTAAPPTVVPTDAPIDYPTLVKPTVVFLIPPTFSKPQMTGVPSPAPHVSAANYDIVNIILTGTDQDVDPSDPSYRTDSMVVVSINRTTNTVSMLSLPRDLYVMIPTYGMQRLNTAFNIGAAEHYQPGGGFGLLQQTILYNFGIPIHFYARISFNGFKQLVDSMNGVDVPVDCPVTDLRYQGPTSTPNPASSLYTPFTLSPGFYHMNGSLALWYARMRHASSDFDRSRRQQQVLRAIWQTARANGLIGQAPQLWSQFNQIVQTNMTLPDVLGLVPLALNLNPGSVTSYYMNKGYELLHWATPLGEDVQIPDPKGFFDTINRFYTPPSSNRLGEAKLSIALYNGSGHADWDKVAADRLTWAGFAGQSDGPVDTTPKTVVYDYTGNAQPALLAALIKGLNVKQSAVISQPDPNRTTDFKVMLGADYNTCSAPGYNIK